MSSLHRKNAAEWVMWAALVPFVPIAWAWEKLKARGNKHG